MCRASPQARRSHGLLWVLECGRRDVDGCSGLLHARMASALGAVCDKGRGPSRTIRALWGTMIIMGYTVRSPVSLGVPRCLPPVRSMAAGELNFTN